ncbi:MAG: paraquat-inducible protein A [Campylobacterota bacterium]|nr:paraquat-inducible protein A [Campylobacterota bacterium]
MDIEIENEDELDEYVICHKCYTLHKEVPIADGSKALCTQCGTLLYRRDSKLMDHGLALSIAGLILFILANLFPLVKIEILGSEQFITIPSMIISLAESGYYLVALFVSYLILIFPLMIFLIYILIFSLMKMGEGEALTKDLLVLLSQIMPWHMSDIFLISILVAIVKLFAMAEIYMGTSFWTLLLFVLLDIYMTRNIHLGELWMLRKHVYQCNEKRQQSALC